MAILSRKADYALLILSHLNKRKEGTNARAVAEAFGLSRPFAANILKELCQKGYVASHRGVKGGYAILRPMKSVTLAELLESINESFQLTVCHHGMEENPAPSEMTFCELEPVCSVKGPLGQVHRRILDVLRNVTLAELFRTDAENAAPGSLPLVSSSSCCSTAPEVHPTAVV